MLHSVPEASEERPAVGLTMFGVTTACVQQISRLLADRFDCIVFHATGTGGQSMEKLLEDGYLGGVLDITTTEVCDHLFGGVLACTDDRFGAVARTQSAVCWILRGPRHGELRGARDRARTLSGTQVLPAQPADHADADYGRRKYPPGSVDCRAAQSVRGGSEVSVAYRRRFGLRCAWTTLLGSSCGCGVVRNADRRTEADEPAETAAGSVSHQRSPVSRRRQSKNSWRLLRRTPS